MQREIGHFVCSHDSWRILKYVANVPIQMAKACGLPYKSRGPPEVGRVQGTIHSLGLLPSASLTLPIQLSKYPNDDGQQDHQNDRYDYTDG